MTWIKICGTTNLEDAQLAVNAGADAVGFVFAAESRRRVTPEQVKPISSALPPHIERFGVFVNEPPAQLVEAAREAGLTTAQLQGDESVDYIRDLAQAATAAGLPMRIVKTLSGGGSLSNSLRALEESGLVNAILLDSGTPAERGGTGRTFAWERAASQIAGCKLPIIVAGGLHSGNVVDAISTLHPWGVDVVTGTESAPGKKDPEKLKAFIAAVKSADQAMSR